MMFPKTLFAALVLGAPLGAQLVTVQVGPNPSPLGTPVYASVTNNTDLVMGIGICPWRILDASGTEVFDATCLLGEALVSSLGTINYRWEQTDQLGNPVPAGNYFFEVLTPGGAFVEPFTVGGVEANLHLKGTPAIGTAGFGFGGRQIMLASPSDPGASAMALASFSTTPGIPTCGGLVPLAPDSLMAATISGNVLTNHITTLDAQGVSEEPLLPLPDQASLVGVNFALGFVVFDLAQPCFVTRVSQPLPLQVLGGAIPFP